MQFIRSDSPEVVQCIASSRVWVRRHLPILLLGLLPNLAILAIALALGFITSWRVAVWICAPVFLAWNVWALWRARSPRLSWVLRAHAGQICVRLFVRFGKAWRGIDAPDVLVLQASEIASMSIRAVEVFLDGSKSQNVEWLMIEPVQAMAENISDQIPSFLRDMMAPDLNERVYWANGERHFAVGWKSCRPPLRRFLQEIVREFPFIAIGPEIRSELDLNGIWRGISRNLRHNLSAEELRILAEAKRLGFGCDCVALLSRYKHIPFPRASEYLTEFEKEARTGQSSV